MQGNKTIEDPLSETGSYFHWQSLEKVTFWEGWHCLLEVFFCILSYIKKMEIIKMQDGEFYKIATAA